MPTRATRTVLCAVLAGVVVSAVPALAAKQVLRLRLNGPVAEAPVPDAELIALLGGEAPATLRGLVKKIRGAADDADIDGMVLIVERPMMGLAQVEEITRAMQAFSDAGKPIYCYMDWGSNLSYVLAAAADHITIAEYSELDIRGLHAEVSFYKGLLDKIGVTADLMHCGDYKAALEPYTRTAPSDEFAANLNWLLDGLYGRWVELVAEGRGLEADQVKGLIDTAPHWADEAKAAGLIDDVGSWAEFKKRIYKEFGKDVEIVKDYPRDDSLDLDLDTTNPFAAWGQMMQLMEKMMGSGEKSDAAGLGLIYIDGPIVMGKSEPDIFSGSGMAGSTTIRAAIESARSDPRVKAVVIRVNSPGGSALASDIMWKAATRLSEEKPLVVSMGGVAGSGGYYVALPGDRIFAEASTITGSIGVVGGKLVWNELFEDKLGITTTEFNRGENAGLMSSNQQWTEEQRSEVRGWLVDIYDQFKQRVMTSRGDRLKDDLEELAGGRVFTGAQALERGLVDEIGGLTDAIAYAAKKAGLKEDCEVYLFPEKKDFLEELASLFGEKGKDEWEIGMADGDFANTSETAIGHGANTRYLAAAGRLVGESGPDTLAARLSQHPLLGPMLPVLQTLAPQQARSLGVALRGLEILRTERGACFMPMQLNLR